MATILVVEDDPDVRKMATAQLRTLGYEIVEAHDAESALDVLRAGRTIDLLFTDVVMPGDMTGLELGSLARELRPGLAVLYTSGFTEASLQGETKDEDIRDYLISKPYRLRELASKVSAVLAARRVAGP